MTLMITIDQLILFFVRSVSCHKHPFSSPAMLQDENLRFPKQFFPRQYRHYQVEQVIAKILQKLTVIELISGYFTKKAIKTLTFFHPKKTIYSHLHGMRGREQMRLYLKSLD